MAKLDFARSKFLIDRLWFPDVISVSFSGIAMFSCIASRQVGL